LFLFTVLDLADHTVGFAVHVRLSCHIVCAALERHELAGYYSRSSYRCVCLYTAIWLHRAAGLPDCYCVSSASTGVCMWLWVRSFEGV